MKTVLDIINLGEEYLKKKGIDRARREAEELIAEALGVTRIALYLDFERPLTEKELEACRQFFARRGKREPFQYIAGSVPFVAIKVKVTPDVLIPRPETEQLVYKIISELEKESLDGKILWDMCTGSGCIGISLKKRFPVLKIILSDISEKALIIAAENAKENGVEVELHQGDMFEVMDSLDIHRKIDFFVSNPPYVTDEDYATLSCEIRQYEPKHAFIAGKDGLAFYRILADKLPRYLLEKAWLEIGSLQGQAVLALFQEKDFSKCFIETDWSGKDRFLKIEK